MKGVLEKGDMTIGTVYVSRHGLRWHLLGLETFVIGRNETEVYTHYTKLQTRPLMQVERSLLSYHTPPSNHPSDLSPPISLKRVL